VGEYNNMQSNRTIEAASGELDFAALLEASFAEEQAERGDIVTGTNLAVDNYGLIVDIGLKRDGIVPRKDL
jgi:ribosomal protein S1